MNKKLRLLIVEDYPDDAELMVMRLEEEGFKPEWQRVENEEDFLKALENKPEFILADWELPQFSGLRALELLNERGLDIPFILVSGSIGEEAAINALHLGASDYILKDRSKRLGQAVRRTLDSMRYQQEKEGAEAELKRRLAELEVLYNISSSLRYVGSLDAMLKSLLEQTLAALNTDTGSIWLADLNNGTLRMLAASGWFTNFDLSAVEQGEGLVGSTYLDDEPNISPEFVRDPRLNKKVLGQTPAGWGGVLVPIHSNQEKIGVIVTAVTLPRVLIEQDVKLLVSIAEMAGIAVHRIRLFEDLQTASESLVTAYHETIKGWANALELRDQETEGHSERVTEITLKLAQRMGFKEEQLTHIYRGSLLHDIGKMGVSDTILLKPGSLDDREWEIMRQHPQYAYDLLAPIGYLKPSLNIPYCHHEKYNGSGYPRGLKGEEIPLEARIFAVVDVYDALISDRPYRLAWSKKDALEHIKKESGTHFDPQVVELFLELIGKTD
jgi:response regulator RpfG family c-di-GMP phosphodiesterase